MCIFNNSINYSLSRAYINYSIIRVRSNTNYTITADSIDYSNIRIINSIVTVF